MTDCLFCKIVTGAIPADEVHRDDHVVAFRDINPQAPTHILLVPQDHHPTAAARRGRPVGLLAEIVNTVARTVALAAGPRHRRRRRARLPAGHRHQPGGTGESVNLHVHLPHLLGGRPMGWPPG